MSAKKLTDKQRWFLGELASCEEGKGLPLANSDTVRYAKSLVKHGWVEVWEAGSLKVGIITEEGRNVLLERV